MADFANVKMEDQGFDSRGPALVRVSGYDGMDLPIGLNVARVEVHPVDPEGLTWWVASALATELVRRWNQGVNLDDDGRPDLSGMDNQGLAAHYKRVRAELDRRADLA